MKNLFPAIAATIIAATAFFNGNAQNSQNSIAKLDRKINTVQFGVPDETTNNINTAYKSASTLSKASSRALKNFAKSFKSPANTNWYDDGEEGFIAYFKDSTTSTHVDYNKKGNWVYTVAMYTEKQLPSYVGFNIKIAYPAHSINSVQEIHYQNIVAYIVHIEDKKGYKTIRYTDEGGVEEIEDLQKY